MNKMPIIPYSVDLAFKPLLPATGIVARHLIAAAPVSRGNARVLVVARALALRPKLLA